MRWPEPLLLIKQLSEDCVPAELKLGDLVFLDKGWMPPGASAEKDNNWGEIVAIRQPLRPVIYDYLIFNPSWTNGHNGVIGSAYRDKTKGGPKKGYASQHWWVDPEHLTRKK